MAEFRACGPREYMHATQLHNSVTGQLSGSIPEQVTTLRELIRQLTRTADSWEHIHEMAKEG